MQALACRETRVELQQNKWKLWPQDKQHTKCPLENKTKYFVLDKVEMDLDEGIQYSDVFLATYWYASKVEANRWLHVTVDVATRVAPSEQLKYVCSFDRVHSSQL